MAAGTSETIYGSGMIIHASSSDSITIIGNNDAITGGSGDTFNITGTYDPVSASNSSVTYVGSDTGDDVSGSGDTGSDWGGYDGGGSGGGGSYGYYGFAGNKSTVSKSIGTNIGAIAQFDNNQGNAAGATAAENALKTLQGIVSSNVQFDVLEGAKWDSNIVTWSLANSSAPNSPFSSTISNTAYQADIQSAFNSWSAATGLTFEEVTDSSQSDIRLGFSDLNTATSGVIGYTDYNAANGQMQADTLIQLEDPNEDALVAGTNGQVTYSGTNATFSQDILHEIGHAIGLGDDTNPNSVMSYYLTSTNQTLSSADIAAANSLYGITSVPSSMASFQNLVQAMATFGASAGFGVGTGANSIDFDPVSQHSTIGTLAASH
jgi:predicted Zn-dependent protease